VTPAERQRVVAATVRVLQRGNGEPVYYQNMVVPGTMIPKGQGVVVPGGLIVTAAHVLGPGARILTGTYVTDEDEIDANADLNPPADGSHLECVQTARGRRVVAVPIALDPLSAIAVLGAPDSEPLVEPCGPPCRCRSCRRHRWSCRCPSCRHHLWSGEHLPMGLRAEIAKVAPVPLWGDADLPVGESFPVHLLSHDRRWIEGDASQVTLQGDVVVTVREEPDCPWTDGGPIVTDDGRVLGLCAGVERIGDSEMWEVAVARVRISRLLGALLDPDHRTEN
jgi:hypothetical protein